jgi:hypothetical protein
MGANLSWNSGIGGIGGIGGFALEINARVPGHIERCRNPGGPGGAAEIFRLRFSVCLAGAGGAHCPRRFGDLSYGLPQNNHDGAW